LNNVTAVVGGNNTFTLGYRCGRIAVFNAATLTLLFLSPAVHLSTTCGEVTSMLLLNNGSCVAWLHSSGVVFAVPSVFDLSATHDGGIVHVPQREIDESYHKKTDPQLLACSGDDCMFGILRYGGVVEISRVSYGYDGSSATVAPVLYGLLRNFNDAYAQDVTVTGAHLVRNGNWLVIGATGCVQPANVATDEQEYQQQPESAVQHLFIGSMNMLTAPAIASRTSLQGMIPHIVVYQRLCLMNCPEVAALKPFQVTFQGKYCVFVAPFGVFALNLLSASVAKSIGDCFGIVEHLVCWHELNLGSNGNWANCSVAASMINTTHVRGDESAAAVESMLDVTNEGRSAYFPEVGDTDTGATVRNEQGLTSVMVDSVLNVFVRRNEAPVIVKFAMKV
jgi:hypothetical protein